MKTILGILVCVFLTLVCIPTINSDEFTDIKCQLKETKQFFYCSGQAQKLYLYATYIIVGFLIMYLVCEIYCLLWLQFPKFRPGSLSYLLKKLKKEMKPLIQDREDDMFDMEDMYFQNKDIKMLMDLLAINSGIAPCIKLLGLFDKEFRKLIEVEDLKAYRLLVNKDHINAVIRFQEPKLIRSILEHSTWTKTNCIYTVEISPAIKSVSILLLIWNN